MVCHRSIFSLFLTLITSLLKAEFDILDILYVNFLKICQFRIFLNYLFYFLKWFLSGYWDGSLFLTQDNSVYRKTSKNLRIFCIKRIMLKIVNDIYFRNYFNTLLVTRLNLLAKNPNNKSFSIVIIWFCLVLNNPTYIRDKRSRPSAINKPMLIVNI